MGDVKHMGDVIDDVKIYYWFFGADASEFGLEAPPTILRTQPAYTYGQLTHNTSADQENTNVTYYKIC